MCLVHRKDFSGVSARQACAHEDWSQNLRVRLAGLRCGCIARDRIQGADLSQRVP